MIKYVGKKERERETNLKKQIKHNHLTMIADCPCEVKFSS